MSLRSGPDGEAPRGRRRAPARSPARRTPITGAHGSGRSEQLPRPAQEVARPCAVPRPRRATRPSTARAAAPTSTATAQRPDLLRLSRWLPVRAARHLHRSGQRGPHGLVLHQVDTTALQPGHGLHPGRLRPGSQCNCGVRPSERARAATRSAFDRTRDRGWPTGATRAEADRTPPRSFAATTAFGSSGGTSGSARSRSTSSRRRATSCSSSRCAARGPSVVRKPLASVWRTKRRTLLRAVRGLWSGRITKMPDVTARADRRRRDHVRPRRALRIEWIKGAITEQDA